MTWELGHTKDTREILASILESPIPELPAREQRLGSSTVRWWEGRPGDAVIMAEGGTIDDRSYAETLVAIQLSPHGYKRATFTFDGDEGLRKTADWPDIMGKAKRLIQSGNVTLLRNGYQNVVGHVVGDHGEYNVEIMRQDPKSRAITQWTCECPWDQYAFQRTRQWKKYEGRPCAHVLATYWKALSTPLDEEVTEEQAKNMGTGQKLPGGKQPIPNSLTAPVPTPPGLPRSFGPDGSIIQGDQMSLPGTGPDATGGPPSPAQAPLAPPGGPGVLPPFPGDQMSLMEQWQGPGTTPGGGQSPPGAVSVPGAKPPSPFNPVQYPGGTYSKTAATEFNPPEIVQLKNPVLGIAEGKSEAHGAGQYREVPVRKPDGSPQTGEVLHQDPSTGWVEIICELDDSGPMEPFHVRCFVEPQDIMHSQQRPPGGFIKRR